MQNGVKQGDTLLRTLFGLFINDIVQDINGLLLGIMVQLEVGRWTNTFDETDNVLYVIELHGYHWMISKRNIEILYEHMVMYTNICKS